MIVGITVLCQLLVFDLTKCFNTIDPDILLFKLENYGIKNKAHSWFKSYLYDSVLLLIETCQTVQMYV